MGMEITPETRARIARERATFKSLLRARTLLEEGDCWLEAGDSDKAGATWAQAHNELAHAFQRPELRNVWQRFMEGRPA